MNKKLLLLLGILTVSAGVLVGCSNGTSQKDSENSDVSNELFVSALIAAAAAVSYEKAS